MSVLNHRRAQHPDSLDAVSSTAGEPCAGCLEETAVGSVFYSDRLAITLPEGGRGFLCSDCHTRARAAKLGEPLSEADLRIIASNGLLVGVGLLAAGQG